MPATIMLRVIHIRGGAFMFIQRNHALNGNVDQGCNRRISSRMMQKYARKILLCATGDSNLLPVAIRV